MLKRFVFLLSKPGHGVIDGSDVEVRAEIQLDALERVRVIERQWDCTSRLIGERVGINSDARFFPLVPILELPDHIVQNERVVPMALARRVA